MPDDATSGDVSWTIGRLLQWTTGYFAQRGVETPRLDAEVLLAHVLDAPRIQLYVLFDQEVNEHDRKRFRELVVQRAQGCPAAYLIGAAEFLSLRLAVDRSVLIPRPETELLVAEVLQFARQAPVGQIADVGAGSGAIAITLAKHLPAAKLIATDICAAALQIARKNAEAHQVADRIAFVESDLFDQITSSESFDVIASNPPYVATEEMPSLAVTVRDYEPRLALDGGPGGLTVLRRLIPQAADRLRPGGGLFLEIGAGQESAVKQLIEQIGIFEPASSVRDYNRLPRVVWAKRRS